MSPFLAIGIINDFVHCFGHDLDTHAFWQIAVSILIIAVPPCLINSLGMLFIPGDLPSFNVLIALTTSDSRIGSSSSVSVL